MFARSTLTISRSEPKRRFRVVNGNLYRSNNGRLERLTLHVPEALNDGAPVPQTQFSGLESELLGIAGGFTLTHGIGVWRTVTGETCREPVRLYSVDTLTGGHARQRMTLLASRIARALRQEAVYLTAQPISPELVTSETDHVESGLQTNGRPV